jgi:hypothetical protein
MEAWEGRVFHYMLGCGRGEKEQDIQRMTTRRDGLALAFFFGNGGGGEGKGASGVGYWDG